MREAPYTWWKPLEQVSYEEAVDRVRDVLQEHGFGIISTIDVQATLREKLGIEHRPYVILGACNPQLAHEALERDDNIGLLLPCNVVVAARNGGSEVAIARPKAVLEIAGNPAVEPVAEQAETRLREALEQL